jgi:hypothetical protein
MTRPTAEWLKNWIEQQRISGWKTWSGTFIQFQPEETRIEMEMKRVLKKKKTARHDKRMRLRAAMVKKGRKR